MTIVPRMRSRKYGRTALVTFKTPKKFVCICCIIVSHLHIIAVVVTVVSISVSNESISGGTYPPSSVRAMIPSPALFTRTSTGPHFFTALSIFPLI